MRMGASSAWRRFKGVASTIISAAAELWEHQGGQDHSARRAARRDEFRRQWTQVTPFGDPDWTMTWTPVHAEIADSKGAIIAERDNGRDAFDRSYDAPWDPLNLAYFNGYAMWTYHACALRVCRARLRGGAKSSRSRTKARSAARSDRPLPWQRCPFPYPRAALLLRRGRPAAGATTMKWTCGRTRRPRTSCRTTSTWTA